MSPKMIGEILLEKGIITAAQLENAITILKDTEEKEDVLKVNMVISCIVVL